MHPTLQGYAAAVLSTVDVDGAAGIASDLAMVDRAIATQPQLSTPLTDTALPPTVRRAVVTEVLNGKVGAPALGLVAEAVSVVPAQDVPLAVNWLSGRARHQGEGLAYLEEPLSATSARRRVGGFAAYVFSGLDVDQLKVVEDELFQVARLIERTTTLRLALVDRDQTPAARAGLLQGVFGAKITPSTMAVLAYAAVGGRARDIVGTVDFLVARAAEARGWRVARVRTGIALDADAQSTISDSLAHIAGHPVDLQVTVDPELLAGILVEIGDLRLDDTIRGRLDSLREHLSSSQSSFVSQLTNNPNEGAS